MMMVKLTIKWEIYFNWAKMEFKKSRKLESKQIKIKIRNHVKIVQKEKPLIVSLSELQTQQTTKPVLFQSIVLDNS